MQILGQAGLFTGEFLKSMLTLRDYERHVEGQLCWDCGVETKRSHARQRQCPKCRKKWSYLRLQQEWLVLKAFCDGQNAHRTGHALHIAYGTVRKYFRRFEEALRRSRAATALCVWETIEGGEALTPATKRLALSAVFSELIVPRLNHHTWASGNPTLISSREGKSGIDDDFLVIS